MVAGLQRAARFPAGRHLGCLVRFDLLQSAQGAAGRWLLGTVCLASVAAMPDDLPDLRASHADRDPAGPRLRIELVGKLLHAKVIEQRP
jgi:hypothetical protein